MKRETHTIDADGKVLGRLASEIALLLRGKHKPDFVLNQDVGDFVVVENIRKIKITGKKLEQKKYFHHSGYLGNLKETSMKKLLEENPFEILKKAVYGMLPVNKLRPEQLKRLKIK
ncbi:50S ribosomal protein L13 [Candidatus Parcubacteria bacterium]|jgi:large subunit ribosomal protein L13|nr:50S ribosomal protein L13 [Candidatus Parcubacteria bacterium]